MWGGGEPGSAAALAEEYFTQRIEEGANLGHIVYEAIHYLQGDPLPVFADTVQLLNNKVLVASTHAESYENIASVEEGISLLIGVISDKIYTLEEVLTFLTEKLEGNTGDGDGNGDGDTPPPPPPPAPTFRVNEADGEVTFSGTAAGNITFTTDSENVATFTRGGITATTKPDLDDITKVTLSSSQTLTGSAADLAKIEAIEGTGNLIITGAPTVAAIEAINFSGVEGTVTYNLSDTLENLAGADADVIDDAESYEISDIDTVFQNVAVAGLPTEAQQALIDEASNKDDFGYSLSDTLENLAGAENGIIDGAESYTLTDEAGVLEDISVAAAEILVDASNAGDYTYSIDDTAAAIDDANANILNGATAITATGTDGDDDIDLSNNLDGPVTTGVTIDLGDGNDIFVGGNGNNVITGGIGNDTITLGEGDDIIVYNNVMTEGGDTIHSFTVGTDKLQFSDADLKGVVNFAAYSGDGAAVTLNDDIKVEFVSNTGENLVASAAEAAFLFDTETGTLSYDADGTGDGEAIIVATLVGVDNLSADDFTFIV